MPFKTKRFLAVLSVASLSVTFAASPALASLQSDLDEATEAAQAAQGDYDAAVAEQANLQGQIDDLNMRINETEAAMPEKEASAAKAVRDMYVSDGDMIGTLESLLTGDDIADVIANIEAYQKISEWRVNEVRGLRDAKAQLETDRQNVEAAKIAQDEKVAEAEAAHQAALAARDQARSKLDAANAAAQRAYLSSQASANGSRPARAATSSSWSDEESARAYIIGKESGGNYQATNGRYYGAYQLTNSYLNGDYSPENQDRVAQNYVERRYGSWVGAAQFWDSHGWY